jgi:hypothetical protein
MRKADFTSSLRAIERSVHALKPGVQKSFLTDSLTDASQVARAALPSDDSSYTWSNLRSGLCKDPEEAIERVYSRYVAQFDEDRKSRRDDSAVWQPVRDQLAARNLLDRLVPKKVVSLVDEVKFDSAWKNGVWHCYQALSFDLTSDGIREKAARWSGHMTGASKSSEKIKPYFIVGAPSESSLDDDYRRAIELLRVSALEPLVFEEKDANLLVSHIVNAMKSG